MSDALVARGMSAQLERRRELLAEGARPLGWKVGFNLPAVRERLGIDRPLAGHLTSAGLFADGATVPVAGGSVAEPEVAVELGSDGRSIAALLPALEVVHPIDLSLELDAILAGNIFHRGVAFGPRVEAREPGAGRFLVGGEPVASFDAAETAAHLGAMVEAVASRLADAGEELRPGERVITGVLCPPRPVEPGDVVRLELDALGAVELRFGD